MRDDMAIIFNVYHGENKLHWFIDFIISSLFLSSSLSLPESIMTCKLKTEFFCALFYKLKVRHIAGCSFSTGTASTNFPFEVPQQK